MPPTTHLPRKARRTALLVVALVAALTLAPQAPATTPDGRLSIELEDAFVLRDPRKRRHRDRPDVFPLTIDITRRGGAWQPQAWAYTPALPGAEHRGTAKVLEQTDQRLRLVVTLTIRPQLRYDERTYLLEGGFHGGAANYTIELSHTDGVWSGTHKGDHHTTGLAAALADAPLPRRDEEQITHGPEWRKPLMERLTPVLELPEAQHEDALFELRMPVIKAGAVQGAAAATLWPMPSQAAHHQPPKPGEHPRLFFTKADLPRLRAAAATSAGKQILANMHALLERDANGFRYHPPAAPAYSQAMWAAGYGLLYQLTGDDSQKEWAKELVLKAMYTPHAYGNYYGPPMFIDGVALAYDMWYDTWDEPFRATVRLYLERNARAITQLQLARDPLRLGDLQHFANPMPLKARSAAVENWNAHLRAVAGLAALAIHGDPVPIREPIAPADAEPIAPAGDYEPPVGVPVVPFTDNNMAGRWLINGPFYVEGDRDMLAALGGRDRARPRPGDCVKSQGVTVAFRHFYPTGSGREPDPVNPKAVQVYPRADAIYWHYGGGFGGYVPDQKIKRPGRDHRRIIYLYTVLDNERERVVQALPNWASHGPGARMWINGREVTDGDLVRLAPGYYPLMIEMDPGGGYATKAPRLREYTTHRHRRDQADYRMAMERYERAGKTFPGVEESLAIASRNVRRYAERYLDPTGWGRAAGHGSYDQALGAVVPFVIAHRRATGVDLADGTGLENLMTLVAGTAGHEGYALGGSLYDFNVLQALPLMPREHLPLAGHYAKQRGWRISLAHQAIPLLASLPEALPVTAPESMLPTAARHERHGVYTFASDWDDPERCFVQLSGGGGPASAIYQSGNFELRGLEWQWTSRAQEAGHWTDRRNGNTLMLHNLFRAAPARLVHHQSHEDNSHTVSIRLDQFRRGRIYSVNGRENLWLDLQSRPKVSWLRAMAIDYSGKSGVPCLIVIADKLEGAAGVHKTWQMRFLPDGDNVDFDAHTRTFFVKPGGYYRDKERGRYDGSLHARLIWPREDVKIEKLPFPEGPRCAIRIHSEKPRTDPEDLLERRLAQYLEQAHLAGHKVERDDVLEDLLEDFRKAVHADEAAAKNAANVPTGFLVVLTLQHGDSPTVQIRGEGLDTLLTIGRRTVRFDGERFSLGEAQD